MPADLSAQFAAFFAEFMNPDEARARASRLATTLNAAALLALLSELRGRSRKVAALAIEMFPALVDVLDEAELVLWIDLAISLAERSGAIAMKYCRESEAILRVLPSADRAAVLRTALELADQDGSLALEGLRQAGGVSAGLTRFRSGRRSAQTWRDATMSSAWSIFAGARKRLPSCPWMISRPGPPSV